MADFESFDAVVIGSGMGGLAAASLLARVGGKRVLVLERHFKAGGFTHTFRRRQWSFDVGLHYVGDVGEGQQARRLFDLASGGAVAWNKMPSPFERFVYPGFSFDAPDDPARYRAALGDAFPAERAGIARWFADVAHGNAWAIRHFVGLLMPRPIAAALELPGRSRALRTTAEVLACDVSDPLLRTVLASQCGTYGLPPSRSAFAVHALIARHYLHGGYYPVGGAGVIAPAFVAEVEGAGGECRVNHEVVQILTDGDRATGVRVRVREASRSRELTVRAPLVISDAGLGATYRLLGRASPIDEARSAGISSVSLFIGFKSSPAALGFHGENHWLFDVADQEAAFAARNEILQGRAAAAFLSFPSLKDPAARSHTAEIVALVDGAPFAPWRERPWLKRGAEYQALKARIAQALLDVVERHHPGFRDLIAYQEVSTPLTVEHFTGHRSGAIYGVPPTPERMRDRTFGARTPLVGLLLTGADAVSLGVMGAFMGGAMAAGAALGRFGIARIFQAAANPPRRRAAEAPRSAA